MVEHRGEAFRGCTIRPERRNPWVMRRNDPSDTLPPCLRSIACDQIAFVPSSHALW